MTHAHDDAPVHQGPGAPDERQVPHAERSAELQGRVQRALGMGGPTKLAARRADGVLNARERVDLLLDAGTFRESGLLATSERPEMSARTPADGKITGFGDIDGRPVAVAVNDFTVLGASSSTVNGKKVQHVKQIAQRRGLPLVFLGESSGARMPDAMGANGGVAGRSNPTQYRRVRDSPWVSGVLGHCYGSSAWYAALSDFVVMRKGAVLAVSSPLLAQLAISETVSAQDMGGWEVHARHSGQVDVAVDTDEQALHLVRRFLGYLPGDASEPPPVGPVPDGADDEDRGREIMRVLPESRTRVYDMRRVLACIVDPGSLFELKPLFGRSITTALARIDGRSVGIVANNPLRKGGAIDPDACSKATSFLVLCDSFNIPLVFVADQPGFLIGRDGERKGAIGRVMNWMNALSLVTVPRIAIVARKSYGQALLNMGLGGNADEVCAWTTAEISFMDPEFGARIVHGPGIVNDPDALRAAVAEMSAGTSAYDAAAAHVVQQVIEPWQTRSYLKQALALHRHGPSAGVGEHLMRAWPTTVY